MSCSAPGATHHLACDCREAEWAKVGREDRELRDALDAERAARERAERAHAGCEAQVRTLVSKGLSAVRGQEGAESALAAEREAHAETRRAWAEMHSAFERARSETDAASSRLAAAEECLREIEIGGCANSRTIADPSGTGTRTLWCPDLPRHRSEWCRGCVARAFLAGGKTK